MRLCAIGLVVLAACVGGVDPDGMSPPGAEGAAGAIGPQGPEAIPRTWQAAQQLADGVYRLEVAGDEAGVVTAVWSRVEEPDRGLYTSTYRPAAGWSPPLMLAPSEEIGVIDVEADRGGGAHALWTSWDGVHALFASRRDAALGWSPVERLDVDDAAGVWNAALAVSRDGDAVAMWVVANFPDYDLMARRYEVGAGWSAPVRVTAAPSHALTIEVALDSYGVATAMWWEQTGRILSARWEPGTPWSPPVEVAASGEPVRAHLAVAPGGAVTAVWPDTCVRSARLEPLGGWTSPACISAGHPWPNRVRLADRRGLAQVAWTESTPLGARAFTSRFDPAGWSAPFVLETDGVEYQAPDVGLDGAGGAVALWSQHDAATGWVRGRRFTPAAGWAATTEIVQQPGFPQESRLAVASSGAAQALWTLMRPEGDLHWSLWTATYQ
jgi:hypothetical protein